MSNSGNNRNPHNRSNGSHNDEFLEDYKEKRKLLVRWDLYFPHEPLRDFDVNLTMILLLFSLMILSI